MTHISRVAYVFPADTGEMGAAYPEPDVALVGRVVHRNL